jgi:hypothetical protein
LHFIISGPEGGNIKIMANSPDLDSYGKPLPQPPSGYHWEKHPDNSWDLVKTYTEQHNPETKVFDKSVLIEHVILPGDTLQGICLRYRVSAVEVRRHNMFSGNNIQFKKTLRIPLEPGVPIVLQGYDRNELKLQLFKNETGEENTEAKIYLEDHNWNVTEAIKAWRQDDVWTRSQELKQVIPAAVVTEGGVATVLRDGVDGVPNIGDLEMIRYEAGGFSVDDGSEVPLLM